MPSTRCIRLHNAPLRPHGVSPFQPGGEAVAAVGACGSGGVLRIVVYLTR